MGQEVAESQFNDDTNPNDQNIHSVIRTLRSYSPEKSKLFFEILFRRMSPLAKEAVSDILWSSLTQREQSSFDFPTPDAMPMTEERVLSGLASFSSSTGLASSRFLNRNNGGGASMFGMSPLFSTTNVRATNIFPQTTSTGTTTQNTGTTTQNNPQRQQQQQSASRISAGQIFSPISRLMVDQIETDLLDAIMRDLDQEISAQRRYRPSSTVSSSTSLSAPSTVPRTFMTRNPAQNSNRNSDAEERDRDADGNENAHQRNVRIRLSFGDDDEGM